MNRNAIVWVEIPVSDMNRAKTFYEAVFQFEVNVVDFGGLQMGWFPNKGEVHGSTGTLIKQESYVPSQEGTLVYFGCNDLENEINRVASAGGTVVVPKTQISEEHGFMGVFLDTEGNRIALHSRN